ncbi:MAG: NUDIX hydrolase [Termitinemataceae bacterium]|nr:MAG: NUDIX hydrolase [Termitinemataceae bacterium]
MCDFERKVTADNILIDLSSDEKQLVWSEKSRKTLLKTRVFSVCETTATSPFGKSRNYSVIEAANWAIVVPEVINKDGKFFAMVKQWRHGAKNLSVEFPGGVIEDDETPAIGAARELREETGYCAGKLTELGCMSPNPAIMANNVYFFLAQDLVKDGDQKLDADEFVNVQLVDCNKVICGMGKPPYIHSLMASALCLYFGHNTNVETYAKKYSDPLVKKALAK